MKKVTLIARLILGLIFFVFGLNGFLNFIPMPEAVPERMMVYMKGMEATGYFLPLLKITEIVCGILLLIGYYVPLALVVLAPIIINIFLVHVFMAPEGLPLAIGIGILETYLAFFADPYRGIIRHIFRCPKNEAHHSQQRALMF